MASPGSSGTGSGRRRATVRTYSAEDQALNQIAREAENRLAARRAARAEARDIRMRELEKQQKEVEEKQNRHYELTSDMKLPTSTRTYNSNTRRGSDDSDQDYRDARKDLTELEDKYKKAMMNNAQLDNEKQTYRYQVDLMKDQLEELEETHLELQRLHKDTTKDLDAHKRDLKDLQFECSYLKEQLEQRDKLIAEYGLVFISNATVGGEDDKKSRKAGGKSSNTAALVTPEAVQILAKGEGTLDQRLMEFAEEKARMEEQIQKLKQQLEVEREQSVLSEKYPSPKPKVNGPDMQLLDMQMENQRLVAEYKFKLKKAEQDITQLEGNVVRLESQVKRYKSAAENAEKQEEELKSEKRRLQREVRESSSTIEELQTANNHLQKRLEKMKATRNALGLKS